MNSSVKSVSASDPDSISQIGFAGKDPLDPRFCWAMLGFIAGSIATVFVAQFFN